MTNSSNTRYADSRDPRFAALIKSQYSFQSFEQAKERLNALLDEFTLSRESDPEDDTSAILWIKGYGLTSEEKKEGYMGNYGRITILRLPSGTWTLQVSKIPRESRFHPIRKNPKHPIPNWGHPLLRSVLTGKATFPSEKEAWLSLRKLHEEYPTATVPGEKRLYVQIFSKQHTPSRVRKFILDIVPMTEGYAIESRVNPQQQRVPKQKIDEIYDNTLAHL